jgi:predicted CxxxxCH...CXXCH cytochrome family protein
VNLATHVDGKVDVVTLTCNSCHGDGTRVGLTGADANVKAAPPIDSHGNSAVTARGVGAHLAHVNQSNFRSAPIACSECHYNAVPTTMTHANGTVAFAFGTLAKNASWGGVTPAPVWNGTTCASTYCHGAFKNGAAATVTWAQDITLGCTSCHGAPPGGNHPQNTSCGNCHGGYTSTSVNKTNHMNGALDVSLTCTSCHGNASQTATASSPLYAAPPVDVAGLSAGGIRIGAHQTHLVGKTYTSGMACQNCHASVGSYTTTHSDGVIQVAFTGASNANLRSGTYTAGSGSTAATCASTWCHAVKSSSGSSSGGTMQTPSWTGSVTACTACHGTPPSTGQHTRSEHVNAGCGACHSGYSSSAVNKTLHVNGTRDVGGTGTRINTWNASTRSCYPQCHDSQTW